MYIVEDFTGKINICKGTVSRDFLLQVFFINHLPQAPENNIRIISNFFTTGCTIGINDTGCAVVHLELRISPRIFKTIRNGPNGIIRDLGKSETDS